MYNNNLACLCISQLFKKEGTRHATAQLLVTTLKP